MCARTVSRHGASTSGDGVGRLIPQLRSHAHPSDPPRHRDRRRSARRGSSRGQSLVEFAMALPVLLFLTLIALDFGRVYLGYINLQNMARIAANYAANNPDAWGSPADAAVQTRYESQVLGDASASNCDLPVKSGKPVVPDPVFVDGTGDGVATGLGDSVRVQLSCRFAVITPVISNLFGGSGAGLRGVRFPGEVRPEQHRRHQPAGRRGRRARRGIRRQPRDLAQHDLRNHPVRGRVPGHLGRRADRVELGLRRWDPCPRSRTRSTTRSPRPIHPHVPRHADGEQRAGSSSSTMDVVVIGASTVDFSREPDRRQHGPGDHVHRRLDARRHGVRLGLRRRRHGHRSDGHARLRVRRAAARSP